MGADRPLASIAARCAMLALFVLLVTVPVYVWVEPWWRPLVARVAAAFVLGVTLLQLRRALALRLGGGEASPLDVARGRRAGEPAVPHQLVLLTGDVRAALRSRHHFDTVLWPRLSALAGRPLARPPARRGRGPSLAGLRGVIADIEGPP
ncbi:MAG TPA: hypothetical protein VMR23_09360 [Candidatus Limnocylindria bacterium]|nr:hypothetical protein [Candidatus Limnocylindria bacterium]